MHLRLSAEPDQSAPSCIAGAGDARWHNLLSTTEAVSIASLRSDYLFALAGAKLCTRALQWREDCHAQLVASEIISQSYRTPSEAAPSEIQLGQFSNICAARIGRTDGAEAIPVAVGTADV